jgi:hypothetical protein
MLQLRNKTPFPGALLLLPDADGVDSLYTVVKATFALDHQLDPAQAQLPIATADQYRGPAGQSSLQTPSDVSLLKPGTDVLLCGTAHAPDGRAVAEMNVSLQVGPVQKSLRVFGDRLWRLDGLRHSISDPEPFETMPLIWERAFGGSDQTRAGALVREGRNPVGAGFCLGDGVKQLNGMKLPNLEDPRALISSPGDRPPPANFGPVAPHWQPRELYAGTYGAEWQQRRAPYLPTDFNPRFFQAAPADQIIDGHLKGGEAVAIHGATRSGELRFTLPRYHAQAVYRLNDGEQARPAQLEAVMIHSDELLLTMVWRAVMPCDKKALRIREVEVEMTRLA